MIRGKFSIPTVYKGIQMRSRLEAEIAYSLDELEIKWEYEKKSFLLENRIHYFVDFFLPNLNTWLEAKGILKPFDLVNAKLFSFENKTELALLNKSAGLWFSSLWYEPPTNLPPTEQLYIGKCSHCKNFFFCGSQGSYHCRKCGNHEGDHDILFKGPDYDEDFRKFFDLEWLKRWKEIK